MSNQDVIDFKNMILLVFFGDGNLLLLKHCSKAGVEGFLKQVMDCDFGGGNVVSDELNRHVRRN